MSSVITSVHRIQVVMDLQSIIVWCFNVHR